MDEQYLAIYINAYPSWKSKTHWKLLQLISSRNSGLSAKLHLCSHGQRWDKKENSAFWTQQALRRRLKLSLHKFTGIYSSYQKSAEDSRQPSNAKFINAISGLPPIPYILNLSSCNALFIVNDQLMLDITMEEWNGYLICINKDLQ